MKVKKQGADDRWFLWCRIGMGNLEVLRLYGEVFCRCSRQSLWLCNLVKVNGGVQSTEPTAPTVHGCLKNGQP